MRVVWLGLFVSAVMATWCRSISTADASLLGVQPLR